MAATFTKQFLSGSTQGKQIKVAGTASAVAAASATLTSNGTNVSNNDTVTIDTKVYTFKSSLTPTEGEVKIGASAAATLDHLKSAITHGGTPDTDYKCAAAHTTVNATTNTDTTQLLVALTSNYAGNSIAFAKSAVTLTVSGSTLTGGADAATTVHTAVSGTSDMDEIWLYAVNSQLASLKLTIEWGETTAPDGNIEQTIPGESGLYLIVPGLLLQNSLVVKAFAPTPNVVLVAGFVNRIVA